MIERIRRSLDKLALYLPGILMALFALGSWWLLRSLPNITTDAPKQTVRLEPDYYLEQFSVKSFDKQGRLTREVSGHRAQHFPYNDTLDISNVTLRSQDTNGQRHDVFTADSMLLNSKSGEYELKGQVRGVIEARQR